MENYNYLPEVDTKRLINALRLLDINEVTQMLNEVKYERLGLDRAFSIIIDISKRYGNKTNYKVLDVGCNNGVISLVFALFDYYVTGIDNGIINSQNLYNSLKFIEYNEGFKNKMNFLDVSVEELIEKQGNEQWDFVFLLSVAHQWEFGYAQNVNTKYSETKIKSIMTKILCNTKYAIYYECPFDEPGFEYGYGKDFLQRYIDKKLVDYHIELIAYTTGPNGYQRQLLRIERM